MKVILRSDLDGLGKRGDIVDVADGHARNFLLPKGHAIAASDGAVEQAGLHVVLAQLQQGLGALLRLQAGLGNDVLVEADGAVDLAAAAEQAAQRHVGLHRVLVDLGQFQEHLDGLVGLLVEEVVQALEILVAEQLLLLVGRAAPDRAGQPPAQVNRDRQQQDQAEFNHCRCSVGPGGWKWIAPCAGGRAAASR